ncbi:hypothetical protein FUAX_43020 (plasmid) [Fulvitalea axinellae]|uniref:RagB/SusD family nutrient uptake outer membrane protein n=1 Tax=Fulvitalea axinellae TaxID=1182444 RepID=A0AAU9CR51_9BACT|nr:hypothetical protein FUAX_43020 [Fulvitalea axinellae]
MKRLYILLISAIAFVSCDIDIEREPYNTLTDNDFWKTEKDLAQACNRLYTELGGFSNRDVYTDISYGGGPNEIGSSTFTPTNNFGPWDGAYGSIARCNKIIGSAPKALESLDEAIVNRYIGEARFFRAWLYYGMLRSYGGVPIIDKLLDLDSPELYAPRNSRTEVADFILADLDYAAQWLPNISDLKGSEEGRVTKTAAQAFLSRVALYEGTRQKYRENGEHKAYLEKSKAASLAVIQSGEHMLYTKPGGDKYSNYTSSFLYEGENSKESILASRYILDWRSHNRSYQLTRSRTLHPTRKMIDYYLADDGLPIKHSDRFQGYVTAQSEYENRDPRLKASVFVPFEDDWWKAGEKYVPEFSNSGTSTGYHWKKYVVISEPADLVKGHIDYMVIRYGEVLLNYAEAVYELGGAITDADLDLSINVLRDRVDMPHLTNAFVNGTNPAGVQLNMLDEIRRERVVELASEGFRYDDLLRWGVAHTVLNEPTKGIKNYGDAVYPLVPWDSFDKDADDFIIIQPSATKYFEDKHYLWPLPLVQVALNENLVQNPGW